MALLDSNMMMGNPPMGYPGQPGMQGPVPQLPPGLAQQLMARAAMRRSPQGNALMASTMMSPPNAGGMMPPFAPPEMPKPPQFFAPQQGLAQNALNAMPKDIGIGMPGQLPPTGQPQMPQLPQNTAGMGLGATAPTLVGNGQMSALERYGMGLEPTQIPSGPNVQLEHAANQPKENGFHNDMFDIWKNLYGS